MHSVHLGSMAYHPDRRACRAASAHHAASAPLFAALRISLGLCADPDGDAVRWASAFWQLACCRFCGRSV